MANLEVQKVVHINQVVADFAGAIAHHQKVFGAVEFMHAYEETERRDASLFVIGDTCLELFSPRDADSLLGRNLARFGESWHSFEVKVPDLEVAKAAFEERGVRLTTYWPGAFFMIHPKDAHGLLIECYADELADDPRLEPTWSTAPWRDGPLGLIGLNAMSAAVRDLDGAVAFLGDLLGTPPLDEGQHPGVSRTATFWLGDTALELAEPSGENSTLTPYLEQYGPRLRSLDFQVRDLSNARQHLESSGLRVLDGDNPGWLAIDPADNHGVLFQFTEDGRS